MLALHSPGPTTPKTMVTGSYYASGFCLRRRALGDLGQRSGAGRPPVLPITAVHRAVRPDPATVRPLLAAGNEALQRRGRSSSSGTSRVLRMPSTH